MHTFVKHLLVLNLCALLVAANQCPCVSPTMLNSNTIVTQININVLSSQNLIKRLIPCSFIMQSILRKVHCLFQSEFFTECNLVLTVSVSSIVSFPECHPVAAYVFVLVFPPHFIFPSVTQYSVTCVNIKRLNYTSAKWHKNKGRIEKWGIAPHTFNLSDLSASRFRRL
jgi:hypothetical protein